MSKSFEQRLEQVEQQLKQQGVRLTAERRTVVRRALAFLHFTAEELVKDVHKADSTIGRATIYRTLALLQDVGMIDKHDFRYGPPNYEVMSAKSHHDHLMCVACGEIIEFQEPRVEALQEEVVQRFGYHLVSHTHKLYGVCRTCQRQPAKARWVRQPPPPLHVEQIVA
ncbi:MAG: transcriptional repressor [Candidatus Omnitrophica bacterium CG11_big_fil_rev_8_21_14_0_20_63_9]|nr:MAG: transcriptional repressor [Candidatus Omnitrophica bacterium CG11_big_fil_rev_8_21_14_0_20_63_9]